MSESENYKHQPRRSASDFSVTIPIEDLHPADGVCCCHCGVTFRVSRLDADNGYLASNDEFECIPNFCPVCGNEIETDA